MKKVALLLILAIPLLTNAQEVVTFTRSQTQTLKGRDSGNGIIFRPNIPIGLAFGPQRTGPSMGLGLNIVYKFNGTHYVGVGSIFWAGHNMPGVVGVWPDTETYGEGGSITYEYLNYIPLFLEYRQDIYRFGNNRIFAGGRIGIPMGKTPNHPYYYGLDNATAETYGVVGNGYRPRFPYLGMEGGVSINKFDISLLCSYAALDETSIPGYNAPEHKSIFSLAINIAYNFRIIKFRIINTK